MRRTMLGGISQSEEMHKFIMKLLYSGMRGTYCEIIRQDFFSKMPL